VKRDKGLKGDKRDKGDKGFFKKENIISQSGFPYTRWCGVMAYPFRPPSPALPPSFDKLRTNREGDSLKKQITHIPSPEGRVRVGEYEKYFLDRDMHAG
jgi:hypothetical protein